MSDWGYVIAGYVLVFVALFAYVLWVVVRGRNLSKQVRPEDRRWM